MLRRSSLLIFLPLCLGVWLAPSARADTAAQARKAIQAAYDREDAAADRKDIKGVLANCAPDFQAIELDGSRSTLADARKSMSMAFQQFKTVTAKTTIQKFTLQGNKATMTVKEYAQMTTGPLGPKKQTHKLIVVGTDQDTWVKHGNRWLKEITRTISRKQTLDGRPIPQ